ncbi:MAG: FAD-dependent oxidoreductase [Clostridiales bacterium]|nr:FAD-dependent oxidoreductase [Clostridiales bacterium]
MMSKIVVVGANHAGTAAINTILDHYPGNEVVVLDANSNISFLGCGMALWIGGQIDGPEGLFYSSQQIMADKGARVHMETTVTGIDFDGKTVSAVDREGNERRESYDKLILATGSLPVIPSIPGRDLQNVQLVKRYQDAQEVVEKLQSGDIRTVAVVGAGYIGVELAEAFRLHGKEVILIDAADTCLSSYYDLEFSRQMALNLEQNGVRLAFSQSITAIEGEGRVQRALTTSGRYDCDMVVLALGFTPNSKLGSGRLDTYQNGAYRVDPGQRTSDPDVFAIGDCAVVYDNAAQDAGYIALATNAVRSGIIAGHNACGGALQTPGVQGSNGIRIWGLNMVATGLSLQKAQRLGFSAAAADCEDYQRPRFMRDNQKVKLRLVYDKSTRRILGAQMCSRYDMSMGIHLFSLAIQEGLTIDKLALLDLFFLPHFNQPYNYITTAALNAP